MQSKEKVMTKDKALDLALEALTPFSTPNWAGTGVDKANEAIAAIKQARSAPVQKRPQNCGTGYCSCIECVMEPAPVQEPVAKDNSNYRLDPPVAEPDLIARLKHPEDHHEFTDPKKANAVLMSLCQEAADALATPVQEPVAFFDWYDSAHWGNEDFKEGCHRSWNAAIKYTTPPNVATPLAAQRQWVEVEQVKWDGEKFIAKLKEKNT
jgi:hypothetical protein